MNLLHRPSISPARPKRIALVLGGGGMKGFAHIGVLQALNDRGIRPTLFAGTSIGALLAAAFAGGVTAEEMERRAIAMRRRDLFRLDHMGMIKDRMNAPSIYLEGPLRGLVESVVPRGTFAELSSPLFVNTVDLERATQVIFGTPGLQDVNIQDAVYASCALPGFFPPGKVGARYCVDGGVVDNLPVQIAALWADLIIAVDVGSTERRLLKDVHSRGFANIYMRSASTMMHALQQYPLESWSGPPMILIRPRCDGDWLSFANTEQSIADGRQAAEAALVGFEAYLGQESGIFPRRHVQLEVARDRCIGCGLCAALAPGLMGLDSSGKAFARTKVVEWSPADGDFVGSCPTNAIGARTIRQAELPAPPSAPEQLAS
ncbi:MAG TPA: patatin-like phospholipase family protein [Gemmatimonadaceae bacterium]|nr:patatin-like phospholipase family protein [Gemmatimonadaceae bacterium]